MKKNELYNINLSLFNDIIDETRIKLKNTNNEYENLRKQYDDIMDKFPKLQLIFEDAIPLELNKQECIMLRKLIQLGLKMNELEKYSLNNSKIMTLLSANRIGNKLLISNFQTDTRSICVCSEGLEYNNGIRELKVGDDVFISSKKPDYITFAHYRIISLYAENNCELIYFKRFYDYNNIDVPNSAYNSFIEDFKLRHNL